MKGEGNDRKAKGRGGHATREARMEGVMAKRAKDESSYQGFKMHKFSFLGLIAM